MKHAIACQQPRAEFVCSSEQTLLQAMEASAVVGESLRCIPAGCRGGGCGQCKVTIISGEHICKKMSVKHISERERENGKVLACRCYPRSDIQFTTASDSGLAAT